VTHGEVVAGEVVSLGIVAAGKSWLDVIEALDTLGLDDARLAALGIAVFKPALIWPLEPAALTDFAKTCRELLFVEEKAALLEPRPRTSYTIYHLTRGLVWSANRMSAARNSCLPMCRSSRWRSRA